MFIPYLSQIAEAYDSVPEYQSWGGGYPYVQRMWRELAADSVERARAIRLLIEVETTDDPEPYPDAVAMCTDIYKNNRFLVSTANSDHPIWTLDENVAFRIVHDVLGHHAASVAMGFDPDPLILDDRLHVAGFDWVGENRACAAHAALLHTPGMRTALFTECIAQTGYAIDRGAFGEQKVADLGQFIGYNFRHGDDPGRWRMLAHSYGLAVSDGKWTA